MTFRNQTLLRSLGFLLLLLVGSSFTPNENPDSILGTWLVGSKSGHVQIYKQGSRYYGKIAWLKQPLSPKTGKPLLDGQNPDPSKRTAPILGLVNLKDFSYSKKGIWENGKVYDPESGKEYSCKITLKDASTLEVRGFIGISLIGRTDVWKRVN
jgi:uncharacterized protein (DUF2147 family)